LRRLGGNSVGSSDSLCGTDGGAPSHAGRRCLRAPAGAQGALSDAFRVVSARNTVVNTHKELVEGAHKQAQATAKTLRQVMWRKLGSTGRKRATNYLSGTTLILTINTKESTVSSWAHERQWEKGEELRRILNEVREVLIAYANVLAQVADVPSLIVTRA
jgi:hypothetical protein